MVTWQRQSSLRSRRVMGITALGRSSFFLLPPFTGPPAVLAGSLAVLGSLEQGYAELRIDGVLRSSRVRSVLLGLFVVCLHAPMRGGEEGSGIVTYNGMVNPVGGWSATAPPKYSVLAMVL
jgi:hypothetical protein